jgi:hypothetical protein
MAQNLAQLTDMWMVNPTMFDPTQASNQFSNYNNAALPWPPSYNPGLQGGPVNAATGKPIQSFQQWQQANPGGMSINATPAAPAPAPANTGWNQNPVGSPLNPMGDWTQLAPQLPGASGQQQANYAYNLGLGGYINPATRQAAMPGAGGNAAGAAGAGGGAQASAPPNNWQAAINALANPGNPTTMGANVPMVTGSQPAGGVNNAFLQQAGAGQGMNQHFLSALRAIQARPQQ